MVSKHDCGSQNWEHDWSANLDRRVSDDWAPILRFRRTVISEDLIYWLLIRLTALWIVCF